MFSGFNRSKTATGTRVTVDLNHDGDRTLRQRPSTSITQAVHHLRHRPAQALSPPGKRAAAGGSLAGVPCASTFRQVDGRSVAVAPSAPGS